MSRGVPWGSRRDTDWDLGAPPHPIPVWPQGEGLRAATWGRPYGGKRTEGVGSAKVGAEGEPHQNQILQTQGLVARRGFRVSLRFCAPEGFCLLQGVTPVMGDRGKAVLWARSARRPRPPAILWLLSHRWESNPPRRAELSRRPQAAKSPCKKRNRSIIAPSSVWPDGQPPSPQGEGLRGTERFPQFLNTKTPAPER